MDRDTIRKMRLEVRDEIASLRKRLSTLEERDKTLGAWEAEEQPKQLRINGSGASGGSPLSVFLRDALSDGKPHHLSELKALVSTKEGLVRPGTEPGRVIHFALLGMQQHGRVNRRRDGTWEKTE